MSGCTYRPIDDPKYGRLDTRNIFERAIGAGFFDKDIPAPLLRSELEALLQSALVARFHNSVPQGEYDQIMEQILSRNLSPQEAVQSLLDEQKPPSPLGEGRGGEVQ
jgi:hypothetical protein